ncbi:FAD-dependent monooxygenase [Nonomuraea sediminis]|uniref:FAD-dependent monooxygenase n=1 Tax=Nonomuraea sediminis TaxID=2835864 RepID=UPI001BDCB596|nr:FAD-dependent monooxygenase [Nonomuraea sediminis]
MKNTNVLISGASIGGPALAYWLTRFGFNVTVVEKAPSLRPGGQNVDFKGGPHFEVLTRMGVLDEVRRLQTGGIDVEIIDADGRRLTLMPGEFTGGELEIQRGDLARVLYDRTRQTCEYVFGDSITSLTQTPGGVHVTFERGGPRTFDLVVGADGIHSNVRRLAFGPESDHVRFLGHYYALVDISAGDFGPVGKMYNEPGRMASLGGPKAPGFFVFRSEPLEYDRHDMEEQRLVLLRAYEGLKWRGPAILEAIKESKDVYLDTVSQVRVDTYGKGRVALLGDAAYGNTLAGFGTGLALVGAYVLAGELALAGGDHRVGFQRYHDEFSTYAKISKNGNAGPFLAPATPARIRMRNLMFKSSFVFGAMMKLTDKFATNITLKDYESLLSR